VGTTIMLKQALATPEWLEQLNLPVLWMDTSGEVRMLTADAVSRTQMPVKPV
jgi:hypothetical protein